MVASAILLFCLCTPLPTPVGAANHPAQAASEPRFTRNQPSLAVSAAPFATNGISDVVPLSWIIEAVRQQAGQRWPVFAIGPPIPCSDREGKLACYHVPVAVGTNGFPDVLTPPPAAQVSLDDLHSPELWAVSQYWTFDVSARKSYYPIPHYGGGLPPFLVTYHKAQKLAQTALNDSQVYLKHYCARGPADEYYEFAAGSGDRVLINARNLRCQRIPPGQKPFVALETTARRSLPATEEQRTALRRDYHRTASEAWDRISHAATKGD